MKEYEVVFSWIFLYIILPLLQYALPSQYLPPPPPLPADTNPEEQQGKVLLFLGKQFVIHID
jgi:hypothetical protein